MESQTPCDCCAAVVQPPTVENPSPSSWSDLQVLEELVPFPPSSLLSFSPLGSQVLRHSEANAPVEEIRKSPHMARERHRFRKDLRPKVDTSARRHPTITKTKASKPQEGEESDFQGCYIVQLQCPILNNNKAQWIQKNWEVKPISRGKKKKWTNRYFPEKDQMAELLDKGFKILYNYSSLILL